MSGGQKNPFPTAPAAAFRQSTALPGTIRWTLIFLCWSIIRKSINANSIFGKKEPGSLWRAARFPLTLALPGSRPRSSPGRLPG